MKKRITFAAGAILFLLMVDQVYSSGAIRLVLPYLSETFSLETMSNGEIAYDTDSKKVIVKIDGEAEELNPDKEIPQKNLEIWPLIISIPSINISGQVFQNMMYSQISKGAIYIGNDFLVNNSEIDCKYSDSGAIANGLGAHDGSIFQGEIGILPMYLYLIKDNENFNCILSFNSDGPEAPYNSGWVLAQTITGPVETLADETATLGQSSPPFFEFTINVNSQTSGTFPTKIFPSMRAIEIEPVKCETAGKNFALLKSVKLLADASGQILTESFARTRNYCAYCSGSFCNGGLIGEKEFYYLNENGEIYFTGAAGTSYTLRFSRWKERLLRSI